MQYRKSHHLPAALSGCLQLWKRTRCWRISAEYCFRTGDIFDIVSIKQATVAVLVQWSVCTTLQPVGPLCETWGYAGYQGCVIIDGCWFCWQTEAEDASEHGRRLCSLVSVQVSQRYWCTSVQGWMQIIPSASVHQARCQVSTEVQAREGRDLPQPTSYVERRSETITCDSSIVSFVEMKRMSATSADAVKRLYLKWCRKERVQNKLQSFSHTTKRLDHTLNELLQLENCDVSLQQFVQQVLVMFHGSAAVESSFSFNKECLVENLHEDSLISQRIAHDAVSACRGVSQVEITKPMIQAVRTVGTRQNECL